MIEESVSTVADDAIVCDVTVGEEVAAIADDGAGVRGGAAVDSDELAEGVAIADAEVGGLALVFEILSLLADGGIGVEYVFRANDGGARDGDVMLEAAAGAELGLCADDAVGADNYAGAEARAGLDDGCGMDIAHVSINPNIMWASETTSSLTTQRPKALATRPRNLSISTWMKRVSPGMTGLRNFTSSALMK